MGKFRKKPVVVEANRWMKNGDHPEDLEGGELRTINSCATSEPNSKIRIVKFEDDTVRYPIHFEHFVALAYDPNHVARGRK